MTRITRILVPTDFSATADAALDYAFGLAEQFGASLQLLHVLNDPFVSEGMSAEAYISEAPMMRTAMLEEAREKLRHRAEPGKPGVQVETEVLFGHGARTIAEYAAERGIDLIVMGTHGRRGFSRMALGSDADLVVRTSPVPVLLVRQDTRDAEATRHPVTA